MSSLIIALTIIAALLILNLYTIMCYWRDKERAIAGERRISENELLGLALLGGTPGAFFSRHLFRHKTRKEPFSTNLKIIACLQVGALTGWFIV